MTLFDNESDSTSSDNELSSITTDYDSADDSDSTYVDSENESSSDESSFSENESSSDESSFSMETEDKEEMNMENIISLTNLLGKKKCNKQFMEFFNLFSEIKQENLIRAFANAPKTLQQDLIMKLKDMSKSEDKQPIIFKILLSSLTDKMKCDLLRKYISAKRDSKQMIWVEEFLKIPINTFAKPQEHKSTKKYIQYAESILDNTVYGHKHAKRQIIQYICQLKRNSNSKGLILGIQGPMGNGKTTLVEKGISKILDRPFALISLGGATDSSFLNGHSYTYEGSTYGQIIDILIKTRVMNPIIYFDELDKVSSTTKGDEIINFLIHLIDPSQNTHFQDRYFGNIDFDLSHAIFVFSYNDSSKIHPILMDRIFEVNTKGFTTTEKIHIANQFLIPSVCEDIGIQSTDFPLTNQLLQKLIDHYTVEAGVRSLKQLLYHIYRERNVEMMMHTNLPSKLSFLQLQSTYLTQFQEYSQHKIDKESKLGKINGLFACSNGSGGILPIEVRWILGTQKLGLEMTGNIGKVMQESAYVARTVAWNLLNSVEQDTWNKTWKDVCHHFHIHCEEMSIAKEGPSATIALILGIFSLLKNSPIVPWVAVTGEVNLSGDIKAIGGLREKIIGAKTAGVKKVLYPKENEKDYQRLFLDETLNDIECIPISCVTDTFPHIFEMTAIKVDRKRKRRVL